MAGVLLGSAEKAAGLLDLAADFLVCGTEDETRRIKVAVSLRTQEAEADAADADANRGAPPAKDTKSAVPVDERADEADEDKTSGNQEKSSSLADVLMKIAKDIVLPTTIAAMIAAKEKDSAEESNV